MLIIKVINYYEILTFNIFNIITKDFSCFSHYKNSNIKMNNN